MMPYVCAPFPHGDISLCLFKVMGVTDVEDTQPSWVMAKLALTQQKNRPIEFSHPSYPLLPKQKII